MNLTKYMQRCRTDERLTLAALSGTHALVDAVCAALVFSLVHIYTLGAKEYVYLVVGYNLLAFALQPLCGMLADRLISARSSAVAGILFSIGAVLSVMRNPYLAVSLAGLGNAFYHVGGGVAALEMRKGKAGPSGIFVAPGAIGLAVGAMIGRGGIPPLPLLVGLLCMSLAAVALCRFPARAVVSVRKPDYFLNREVVIALLLLSVALRSLLGFSVGGFWQGNRAVLLAFAIAAMCGKAAGGLTSDRFGWTRTGTAALMFAALLFGWGAQNAWCAVGGILLLQMTMPLTLAAMYCMFPGRPGLAFGLCCLALVIGASPAFSPWADLLRNTEFVVPCALCSVAVFFACLQMVPGSGTVDGIQDKIIVRMETVN